MRAHVSILAVLAASISGCDSSLVPNVSTRPLASPIYAKEHRNSNDCGIRAVTFRSHLCGADSEDPIVRRGERIRVIPDAEEPPSGRHDSIVVRLPNSTPVQGDDELYYLRGYAIGCLAWHNQPFL